ncbi:MAG: tRNA 5-methoxyuridine(34)/uridine 5-oxyacetic acid(34) synthase CmoB [Gammaproteobacteria bacterium TMED133]|nr:MAG: tRNA 5-methoxyuridine(34)/uridine 5-oxyacetic acid(34) synthase CmoB [Gammaproteobacteria bacterium TMED133]
MLIYSDKLLLPFESFVTRENLDFLRNSLEKYFKPHGKDSFWEKALFNMPSPSNPEAVFSEDVVRVSSSSKVNQGRLVRSLKMLMPWRKGPFHLFGLDIDAEWRSELKWRRLIEHIAPLHNRKVLDVGCGNGYYLFRILGEGAKYVVGIDPTRLFFYQFRALQQLFPKNNAFYLPLRSEQLPSFNSFDTVFSMGVLYHRRSAIEHLRELISFLRPGGELILETLIVPGDASTVLVPHHRYASMANVWSIPSSAAAETWLTNLGMSNVRTVDTTRTGFHEQRKTQWMQFQSLDDFLDPNDKDLTIEKYPAPTRAILLATKPF